MKTVQYMVQDIVLALYVSIVAAWHVTCWLAIALMVFCTPDVVMAGDWPFSSDDWLYWCALTLSVIYGFQVWLTSIRRRQGAEETRTE